jgi:phospholipid-binding lipoprotein MlaA
VTYLRICLTAFLAAVPLAALPLGGCAHVDKQVFEFNLGLARHVLRPMSEGYKKVVPQPIRTGLRNVTDNVKYTDVFANNLLQGKLCRAHTDLQRLLANTVIGFGGIFDPATDIGIPKYEEDFGQTLGVWGFGPGPYFNIPFLGPSTARDAMQHPFRFASSPFTYVDASAVSLPLSVAGYLFERFDQVGDLEHVEEAVDPYAFVKKAYLEKREDLVYDGNPPGKKQEEDEAIDDALEGLDEDLDEDLEEDLDELDGDLEGLDGLDEGALPGDEERPDAALDELDDLEDDDLEALDELDAPPAVAKTPAPDEATGGAPGAPEALPSPQVIPRRGAGGTPPPRAAAAAADGPADLPPPKVRRVVR